MTVRVADGMIHLEGRCLVEDAEPLLVALQDHDGPTVNLEKAVRLHLAVVQILVATKPVLIGGSSDTVFGRFLLSMLA